MNRPWVGMTQPCFFLQPIVTYRYLSEVRMHEKLELKQAAEYLQVSRQKLWRLVKQRVVPFSTSPLDRRKKFFDLAELKKLKETFAYDDNH